MKTKAFFVTVLMSLPAFIFGQSFYDDLYSKSGKTKTAQIQQEKTTVQNEESSAQSDNQYRIESTRIGDKDIVVVRNMNGDTVYYSGDNKQVSVDNSKEVDANGEYANRIKRFHNDGNLIIEDDDSLATYPLDNVSLTINVNGGFGWGWPYWGYRHSPYGYWGNWYAGWYDTYWDLSFGWDYPYYGWGWPYYGWIGYPYYGGGYYGGGWGRSVPYNYTAESRRQALSTSGFSRSAVSGSRFNSASAGTRSSSASMASSTGSSSSRSNTIGTRGNSQNTAFWNNFLSSRGYNVSNGSRSSSSNGSSAGVSSYSSRSSYSTGSGSRRSSESVSVPSSSSSAVYYNSGSRSSSASSSSYNNSRSSSTYTNSNSNYNNSSSYSSGSRSSSSNGSSYSGGGNSGGGSRGGGGGGRR
jgi:hypothetical protein